MITITELARTKILKLMEAEGRSRLALRFAIDGRGPGGFRYRLGFVEPEDRRADDTAVPGGGFDVLIDPASAPQLSGATVDFVEGLQESGFKIDNPNSIWADPRSAAVQRILDQEINPAIASHGGYVTLLDVKDDVAYVALHGGCHGCGMADVTLRQGIEVRIRAAVPEITAVVDSTDHAGGTNPYYQPAQGGSSPLG
ncbi:MAG TPA: iron-sulfur cluster assembly accessory protein [Candidatus Limnocylindria bacterium]|nr:iron-sulfur cluster assembly accessory protein [Candidatus Limnocylindria bacterium]